MKSQNLYNNAYTSEDYLMYVCENNAMKNIVILENIHSEKYILVDWDITDQEVKLIADAFSILGLPEMAIQGDGFKEGDFREVYNSFYYLV